MSSHAACDHPATKAARAACRARRRQRHPHWVDDHASMTVGERMDLDCEICCPETCAPVRLNEPESAAESLTVEHVKLSKGKLFAGIWVRLRCADEQDWQSGHLLSAASDNVRVVLDSGELIQFRWESGTYEMEQEIYTRKGDNVAKRRGRHARYSRR